MDSFLSDQDFKLFSTLIYQQSGIHFSESNRSILESRLRERLRIADIRTVRDYYAHVQSAESEMRTLLDSVTTNLTRFFRNNAHFETFENFVIPQIVERKRSVGSSRLRVWSAGCSTGEEAYSVAMVLADKVPKTFHVEIIASDLSLKSLLVASEGFYPETRMNGVPQPYRERFFEQKRDGFVVSADIRKLCKFDYHNLNHESGETHLDIVFCRNVLIYFDAKAQKAVVERFYNAMNPYSYLFIGHSESLFGMDTRFEFLRTDWGSLYQKGS